ncbi:AAA family ATPase [Gillisia sp. Q332]|uniref:AAA family ATPase n=1 Tax=Gillisia xinjiangensis TaxID=3384765 RepID=UPI003918F02A
MENKRILITGGPGSGKSSVIKKLEADGHYCLHEVSREVTAEAQKQGIDQLFLEDPFLFSFKLLEARVNQHHESKVSSEYHIFIDRGIPDVIAYMEYFGTEYPSTFTKACTLYKYEKVFLLPPWEEIYVTDNERYETFEQAKIIHSHLQKTYLGFGYEPLEVPKNSIEERCDFILNNLDV